MVGLVAKSLHALQQLCREALHMNGMVQVQGIAWMRLFQNKVQHHGPSVLRKNEFMLEGMQRKMLGI